MKDLLDRLQAAVRRRVGSLDPLAAELRRLHEGFTGRRGDRPPDYLARPAARRAYLASFALPNAARAHHALRRAGAGLAAGERALDAGAGTGSAALALAALSHPDSEIVLADRSEAALAEARSLFAEVFPDGPRAVTRRVELAGPRPRIPEGPFRTVVAANLLNELLPPRGRSLGPALPAARALADRMAGTGTLVLVEPAQRVPSRALSTIRSEALSGGLRPVGPCTHSGECPVLARGAKDWCVVDLNWQRPALTAEVDRLLGLDRARLALSWLGLARTAKAAEGALEVLSEPMRAAGGFVVYLCGREGRLAAGFPTNPPPLPRGTVVRLPKGVRASGRDRSGAPLFRLGTRALEVVEER